MLNLVANENMKIYRRMRTWIMVALLIAAVITISFIMKSVMNVGEGDWRPNVERDVTSLEQQVANDNIPDFAKREIEIQLKVKQANLERDIPPIDMTLWGGVKNLSPLVVLVIIFTVIVAGDIVAGEFSTGTIKLLLIRPASRSKILLSKYISSFLFAAFLLVVMFLSAIIVNALIYGIGDANLIYLHLDQNYQLVEDNIILHVLSTYGFHCISLIMIVTIAFMISSVFRSSSLAIGLSIFVNFIGTNLAMFLAARYSWGKYFLFANTDLSMYLEGRQYAEGMTLQFSIVVLIVYFIIFNICSWLLFNKRDVAA